MFTKQKIFRTIACTWVILQLQACTKNITVYQENTKEITTPVSLSKDLQPIFDSKCSTSGCHNSSGHVPDLTATRAYNSLINGNYVNVSAPDKSELYLWLTGKKNTAMPVGGPSNPSNINNLVLAWIKQGAKNN
jgi:hypothetical protein